MMSILCVILAFCILMALGILILPISRQQTLKATSYASMAMLMISFSVLFYCYVGSFGGLSLWVSKGESHYHLAEQINQLGGIPGIISQIKLKLAKNPNDGEGWFILGKLYLNQQNKEAALDALEKAQRLKPTDPNVARYFKMAVDLVVNKSN